MTDEYVYIRIIYPNNREGMHTWKKYKKEDIDEMLLKFAKKHNKKAQNLYSTKSNKDRLHRHNTITYLVSLVNEKIRDAGERNASPSLKKTTSIRQVEKLLSSFTREKNLIFSGYSLIILDMLQTSSKNIIRKMGRSVVEITETYSQKKVAAEYIERCKETFDRALKGEKVKYPSIPREDA